MDSLDSWSRASWAPCSGWSPRGQPLERQLTPSPTRISPESAASTSNPSVESHSLTVPISLVRKLTRDVKPEAAALKTRYVSFCFYFLNTENPSLLLKGIMLDANRLGRVSHCCREAGLTLEAT